MFNGIDLSSDTVTKPTHAMLNAMVTAKLGDEQKGEDPTTKTLESLIAEKLGLNAAVFLPSATMANQIAIQCLADPGDQLIAAANSHLFRSETGGPAIHARVMCNPIITSSGIFTTNDIKQQIHKLKSVKHPVPSLLSIENTSNLGGGSVWSKNNLADIVHCADELKLKKHMDGSRIFNASIKTGLSVKELCRGFDTVTICLSKGLGCPIGALLVFDKIYENKILRLKHLMGGAMRQSGVLASAGIYALENNIERLAEDHHNASLLADKLSAIAGIQLLNSLPETNIVLFKWVSTKINSVEFYNQCLQKNVRFSEIGNDIFRAVTHLNISETDINKAVNIIDEIANNAIMQA